MRLLSFINLAGVLALAVLCVAQWQDNRQFNQEINRLEAIRLEQAGELDKRDATIKGQSADLDLFRGQITTLTGDRKEINGQLRLAQQKVAQLESATDQLKESVLKWSAAVEERDARIREIHDQIRGLASDLNATVLQYNTLATNYNESVRLLNERTAAYNELVAKFNEPARK